MKSLLRQNLGQLLTTVVNVIEMSEGNFFITPFISNPFSHLHLLLLETKNHLTMPVGEAFLSAFLQVLFDRLASNEFIGLFCGLKYGDLLEHLKITLLTAPRCLMMLRRSSLTA